MDRSNRAMVGILPVAILAISFSVGCVTKGKYELLETQRNNLEVNRDTLTAEVAQLQAERDKLIDQLASVESEKDKMSGTYSQLVSELQSEVASGQVQIQQIVDGVRLAVSDELLFKSGSANLGDKGKDLMERVAEQIKGGTSIVTVEGHTDNVAVGPGLQAKFPTNWELAGARAAIVVRLLAEKGVQPERMRAVSRGPFSPLASNDTADGRAKNRRTEILLRPIPVGDQDKAM
jgi:chemotaxis protein MotB